MATRDHKVPIEWVARNGLCTGCGACAGACPASAIEMKVRRGCFVPSRSAAKCRQAAGCDVCFRVCPGHQLSLESMGEALFPQATRDASLGRVMACCTGHAAEHDIRFHGASGGVVSQLLVSLLEGGQLDGAVVTRMGRTDPMEPDVFVAKTREEILEARSSKYCPVPAALALREVLRGDGKYAVVGLPCHIHAFRKAEKLFPALSEKVVLYCGLFCSTTHTFNATEYLLSLLGVRKEDVTRLAYRAEGCPGSMVLRLRNGEVRRWAFASCVRQLRSFFVPHRCSLCADHAAELADISCGDIYIPEFRDDRIGTTAIIVRSTRGQHVLQRAQQCGCVELRPVTRALVLKSQRQALARKKRHLSTRLDLMRLLGRASPRYDIVMPKLPLAEKAKCFLSTVVLHAERLIGQRRTWWPIIKHLAAAAQALDSLRRSNKTP